MAQPINMAEGYMNNFIEISENEALNIDGGWDWGLVLLGATLVVEVVAVAASAPVSLPVLAAGGLCAASAVGGAAIGYGATH